MENSTIGTLDSSNSQDQPTPAVAGTLLDPNRTSSSSSALPPPPPMPNPQAIHQTFQTANLMPSIQSFVSQPSQAMSMPFPTATQNLDNIAQIALQEQAQKDKKKQDKHREGQARYRDRVSTKKKEQKRRIELLETQLKDTTGDMQQLTKQLEETKAELEKSAKKIQSRWPFQTNEGSQSMSKMTSFQNVNPVKALFEGGPIDPSTASRASPQEEESQWQRNSTLRDQVLKSIKYYIKKEEECKEQYWKAKEQFDKPTVPLQKISGGRWDFILNVQLQDGKYLFGYLLKAYNK